MANPDKPNPYVDDTDDLGTYHREPLTLDQYQLYTRNTAVYPDAGKQTANAVNYSVLGLIGESGELANHWKKVIRDPRDRALIQEKMRWELGDVLWYVARAAEELGMKLEEVAHANLEKLKDRKARDAIRGSGDKR